MDQSTKNNLQYVWRKILKDDSENRFHGFRDFAEWSLDNGFVYGAKLRRIDSEKGWSRENCEWIVVGKRSIRYYKDLKKMQMQWDKFATPLRRRYKKELESILDGLPIVKEPEPPKEQIGKSFFRYEHPDLVREGIQWVVQNEMV